MGNNSIFFPLFNEITNMRKNSMIFHQIKLTGTIHYNKTWFISSMINIEIRDFFQLYYIFNICSDDLNCGRKQMQKWCVKNIEC